MKKTLSFISALAFVLAVLTLSGCSSGKKLPDDEAMARINELLPLSNEVNEILFGKGLPAVDEAYEEEHDTTAYFPVKDGTGYSSVADIKRAAEKVYSRSYLGSVYLTAFEGVSGEDSPLSSVSARYSDFSGVLKVNVAARSFDIRKYERVTECAFRSNGNGYAVYSCRAVTSDGETVDVPFYLTEQDGVWLFDSPAY